MFHQIEELVISLLVNYFKLACITYLQVSLQLAILLITLGLGKLGNTNGDDELTNINDTIHTG